MNKTMNVSRYLNIRSLMKDYGWRAFPYVVDTYEDGTISFINREYKQIAVVAPDGTKTTGNPYFMYKHQPWQDRIQIAGKCVSSVSLYNDGCTPLSSLDTRINLIKIVDQYDLINEVDLFTYPLKPLLHAMAGRSKFKIGRVGMRELDGLRNNFSFT